MKKKWDEIVTLLPDKGVPAPPDMHGIDFSYKDLFRELHPRK